MSGDKKGKRGIYRRLSVPCQFDIGGTVFFSVSALVDTGSEVNLVRRNFVPPEFLHTPHDRVELKAANQTDLGGVHQEVVGRLIFQGSEVDSKDPSSIGIRFKAYDADIDVDVLLSYEWCSRYGVDVKPRRHGILIHHENQIVWVTGFKHGQKIGEVTRVVTRAQVGLPARRGRIGLKG